MRIAVAAFVFLGAANGAKADGTGFVVSNEGHLLTSYHVIQGCNQLVAEHGGASQTATLLSSDPSNDLALLQLGVRTTHAASFRAGPRIRPGDGIVVVGFPLPGILASQASVTTGTVSADAGPGDDPRFLQISAPIQSGNSGGPLLDRSGHVVGMIFAKLDALALASVYGDIPQNINFAVKHSVLRAFLVASGVPIGSMNSDPSRERRAADVGAQAKQYTVFLKCAHQLPTAAWRPTAFPSNPGAPTAPMQNGDYLPRYQTGQTGRAPMDPRLDQALSSGRNRLALSAVPMPEPARRTGELSPLPGAGLASAPQAPPPPRLPRSADWGIQVGAFHSVDLADRALSEATSHGPNWLRHTEILIVPTQTATGTLYRARLAGLDRGAAGEACVHLKQRGISCFVVPVNANAQ